ncbi:MAG: twin-arginine translocase subunit TatC [Actinomycetales bacterium]|nr:twin-arginine translocase subunit TatC [Actinomycetales bacterium]
MPLREHLVELRTRMLRSSIAVLVGAVAGWFLYTPLYEALQQPLLDVAEENNIAANLNFTELMGAFNLQLKLSVYLGVLVASPVWLYQLWAFVVPGLTRRERRYAMTFAGAAVPMFVAGVGLAWLVLPNAVGFFTDFVPQGSSIFTSAEVYFGFATRLMLVFGLAFVLPLFLVALNLVGVLGAKTLVKGWRIAVVLIFLFAAIASPSPEVGSMIALALPMVALYLAAMGIAVLNDRRRARRAREEGFADLQDDEASPL